MSRWTIPKKLKLMGQASTSLLDVDRIIVPVHLPNHWVCAVIDMQNQIIAYMDSLGVSCTLTLHLFKPKSAKKCTEMHYLLSPAAPQARLSGHALPEIELLPLACSWFFLVDMNSLHKNWFWPTTRVLCLPILAYANCSTLCKRTNLVLGALVMGCRSDLRL